MNSSDTNKRNSLRIRGLWKAFGNFVALKDITLDVSDGEFICFLGPSGCGKTTLLRAIAGLDLQSRGTIEQNGKDISNLPPALRDFGIVFQSYALFPNLSIEKNIAFGLENVGKGRQEVNARVDELLELVGLADQAKKYPAQLSGGQQQRIALARAIAIEPGLLLLDEPLSALDAKVRVSLRHEIKKLQRKLGITTIMVTHDQEEGLSMADRIVVMNHGVIEQVGTPIDVYRNPKTLFVADFIGDMNQLTAVAHSKNKVAFGEREFICIDHDFPAGVDVTATIRPEDIVPHVRDMNSTANASEISNPENCFDAEIEEMEFLGSSWIAKLTSKALGQVSIKASFSMNAVKRMGLETGALLTIEFPPDKLRALPKSVPA